MACRRVNRCFVDEPPRPARAGSRISVFLFSDPTAQSQCTL